MKGYPQILTPSRRAEVFGSFKWSESIWRHGEVEILDVEWKMKTIIRVAMLGLPVQAIWFHKKASAAIRSALSEIVQLGLSCDILTFDGSYVPRHVSWNPKRGLSSHSWGIALDLNAGLNPFGREGAKPRRPGSVHRLVPIFERHGFAWGGRWKTPDYMHFEATEAAT